MRSGAANLTNSERPIMTTSVGFDHLSLAEGTYWLDILYSGLTPDGNTTVFYPIVMDVVDGLPVAVKGNAYQEDLTGWNLLTGSAADGGVSQTFSLPFLIQGTAVPEPSSCALALVAILACGGVISARRSS